MKKLVVLLADKDAEVTLAALFERVSLLGIQDLDAARNVDIFLHQNHDSGCRTDAHNYLRPFARSHEHALVIFDYHGSGLEHKKSAEAIETDIENQMSINGWDNRSGAIVLDPELEVWVWSPSPHVEMELGWSDRTPHLQEWLRRRGYLNGSMAKPDRPKEAMLAALHAARMQRSASIFRSLAQKVDFGKCTDRAFCKFRRLLQEWFRDTKKIDESAGFKRGE